MSIDFSCSKCQRTIRVPDGSEGKKTKCPQCQEIQPIPTSSGYGSSSQPTPAIPSATSSSPKSESMWDSLSSDPETSSRAASKPNPFGDGPDPFGAPRQNPYSSPAASSTSPYGRSPMTREMARSQLLGPAIGVLISTGLGSLLMGLMLVALLTDMPRNNGPEDQIMFAIVSGVMFGLPVVFGLCTMAAMLRAFAVKNYGLVMAGFILSLTPFSGGCGCILALAFGIWGIVVMCDDSIKRAFNQP